MAETDKKQLALEISQLAMKYLSAESWVFENISLSVNEGEFVVVIGPSGCGKSTLLRLIAGFEKPLLGKMSIGGKSVIDTNLGEFVLPEKRGIGFVFQSYALWPHMTVKENINFALEYGQLLKEYRRQRENDIINNLGLELLKNRYPAELSGGQRQRVALARALAGKPTLLLMDEPLSSLDNILRRDIQNELISMRYTWRPTVLYVTHDQEEAIRLADRIILLHEGIIQQQGTPYDIYHCPRNNFVANFFGEVNELDGHILEKTANEKYLVNIGNDSCILARGPLRKCMGSAKVLIRPTWFEISEQEDSSLFKAEIIESRFMGAITYYRVAMQNREVIVMQAGGEIFLAHKEVYVKIKDAWVM